MFLLLLACRGIAVPWFVVCSSFLQLLAVNHTSKYACIGMSPFTAHYAVTDAKASSSCIIHSFRVMYMFIQKFDACNCCTILLTVSRRYQLFCYVLQLHYSTVVSISCQDHVTIVVTCLFKVMVCVFVRTGYASVIWMVVSLVHVYE